MVQSDLRTDWQAHAPTWQQAAWTGAIRNLPPWLRKPLQRHFRKHVEPGWQAPLDIVVRGVRYRCHFTDNIAEYKLLFQGRRLDNWHLRHLTPFLRKASVFVDIGANFGYYALNAARIMPSGAKIIAVEPSPVMAARLRTNIAMNGFSNISVVEAAAGNETGTAVRKGNLVDHGGAQYSTADAEVSDGPQITMLPLVDIIRSNGCDHVDVLKIDVEGFEDKALLPLFDDAPRSLWPRIIVIEDASKDLWSVDVLARLRELGYAVHAEGRSDKILKLSDG